MLRRAQKYSFQLHDFFFLIALTTVQILLQLNPMDRIFLIYMLFCYANSLQLLFLTLFNTLFEVIIQNTTRIHGFQ